jgi:hypothetical protein
MKAFYPNFRMVRLLATFAMIKKANEIEIIPRTLHSAARIKVTTKDRIRVYGTKGIS